MGLLDSLLLDIGLYPLLAFFGLAVFFAMYAHNENFLYWLQEQSIENRDYILGRLDRMFITSTPNQVILGLLASSVGVGILVFTLLSFSGNWWLALVVALVFTVLGWKVPRKVIDFLFELRVKKFNLQMVDGLGLMANGMKSGLSVQQSLALVVDELPNPISQEFELVLSETKLGVTLEDAFMNLAKRLPNEDTQMFVTAVVILKETGGNLATAFDTIVYTIRERIKIEKKIDAMTSMGKMQGATLFCMPIVICVALSVSDPELMKPMFTTTMGILGLMLVLSLQLIGGFLVLKLTKVNV